MAAELLEITRRIYEEDPENDPYDGSDVSTLGYTAAAIMELACGFNIPVHVMWGASQNRFLCADTISIRNNSSLYMG